MTCLNVRRDASTPPSPARLACQRRDAQRRDAVADLAQHVEAEAVEGEALARRPGSSAPRGSPGPRSWWPRSSGSLQSIARLRSRIGTAPSTLTEPSGCGRTPGTATSCSSVMSPTISSRMSSSVTRPITSPYSSTTSAKWRLAAAERLELLGQRADVGHEPRRQRDRHDVDLREIAAGPPGSRAADPWRAGCRRCSPGVPRQSGRRVHRRVEHRVARSPRAVRRRRP